MGRSVAIKSPKVTKVDLEKVQRVSGLIPKAQDDFSHSTLSTSRKKWLGGNGFGTRTSYHL